MFIVVATAAMNLRCRSPRTALLSGANTSFPNIIAKKSPSSAFDTDSTSAPPTDAGGGAKMH